VSRCYPQKQADDVGETIEAAIIVGVLLSFVEQLMTTGRRSQPTDSQESTQADLQHGATVDEEERKRIAKLLKRMRLQIWAGTLAGFFLALCIGAAFIAVVSP
jgi:high-affinity iron transporter